RYGDHSSLRKQAGSLSLGPRSELFAKHVELELRHDGSVAQRRIGSRGQAVTGPLLDVRDLTVSFRTPDGVVEAGRNVSFSVDRRKTLGIVGESGSGKSVATQTVAGLTRGARVSGRAFFDGRDLLSMPESELRALRGRGIAMIFQNPLSSLHPFYRIGWQI